MNKSMPILQARDVRKTYRLGAVDVPVLKGAGLEVRDGEWVAILGASGSGKSTLLHLLGDLDSPDADSGDIVFAGRSMNGLGAFERNQYRNQTVGFVFQFYHLLPELNVVENAMLPGAVRTSLRSRPFWALFMLGLAVGGAVLTAMLWRMYGPAEMQGRIATIGISTGAGVLLALLGSALWTEVSSFTSRFGPLNASLRRRATDVLTSFGLGHRLKHRPRELSGGERQRVAIARALMNQPRILLADEPTGNLDEKTGNEILDLIAQQHRQGLTIVMVTHDPAIARRADRIVRLHDGRVVDG
jgi:ABC-type lipoprotein export system ATPase subunit